MSPKARVLSLIERWQTNENRPKGACRFDPTCSRYAYAAISEYGLIRGGLKGVWRVWRCNPFTKGGFDPLKPRKP